MVVEYLDEITGVLIGLATAVFAFFGVIVGALYNRVSKLETDRDAMVKTTDEMKAQHNAEILQWFSRMEESARTKRMQGDYIDTLQHHIWDGKGPPPPPPPDGI